MYQKGVKNQADYLSRHAKPFSELTKEEHIHASETNNLLYMLHTTPVMDCIGLATIATETENDQTLKQLWNIINKSQTWIPKDESEKLKRFTKILPELTVTGNGIILKSERIILPEALQALAIELAHRGSHTRQSGMERRLRAHFFFHDMESKVEKFLSNCHLCATFSNKKTSEPLGRHAVPNKCWDTVAVDLFGPMPSRNHVVVVQDLASKYPAAKLVSSTSAEKVLPVLSDIYDTFGNPSKQISDNGSPFNSKSMDNFAHTRDIHLQKIPPLHPSSNPAETFMRPLGKTMKIAHATQMGEKEALNLLLNNYRNTPHPATGMSPSAMLFRDGQKSNFPRLSIPESDVTKARQKDLDQKQKHQSVVNQEKFRIPSSFQMDDKVMLRNFQKQRKFDPTFLPDEFEVVAVEDEGRSLTVKRSEDGASFRRHPDDIKPFAGSPAVKANDAQSPSEHDILKEYMRKMSQLMSECEEAYGASTQIAPGDVRPQRQHIPNPRYFNDNYVNTLVHYV